MPLMAVCTIHGWTKMGGVDVISVASVLSRYSVPQYENERICHLPITLPEKMYKIALYSSFSIDLLLTMSGDSQQRS